MATQSDVNALKSELRQLQSQNHELEREISALGNSLQNALGTVSSAEHSAIGALENGTSSLTSDDKTLKGVALVEEDIRERMILYKNIENAYKTIRGLKNDLAAHQGNEKTVRRIITAMVENDEHAFASDETVREQSEKMYLQTQYYFLSHIMMDLQLRKSGESAAADRARAKALEMDERKSAWVYFMIALKNEKPEAQSYWLTRIMEKPLMGNEKEQLKVLTLLCLKDDNEDSERIRSYIGLDKLGEIDKDDIVNRVTALYGQATVVKPPEFRHIDKYVSEKVKLSAALKGAMNNEEVGSYVVKLRESEGDKMRRDVVTQMFDSILETCHSPKAQEIYDEIAYQEKIIEAKGRIEEAMAKKAQEEVEKVSNIDLEECLFRWLNDNEHYNGKREINALAYSKFKPSYRRAYKNFVKNYRSCYSESVSVKIDEYNTKTPLQSIDEEMKKIDEFCRTECAKEKAAVKDTKFILFTVFGALLLVGGIIMNFALSIGVAGNVLAALAAVAGVALLVLAAVTKFKNYKRRIEIGKKWEKNAVLYAEKMQYVFGDIQSFRELYRAYDATVLDESFF